MLTEGRPPGQRPSLSHAASRQKKHALAPLPSACSWFLGILLSLCALQTDHHSIVYSIGEPAQSISFFSIAMTLRSTSPSHTSAPNIVVNQLFTLSYLYLRPLIAGSSLTPLSIFIIVFTICSNHNSFITPFPFSPLFVSLTKFESLFQLPLSFYALMYPLGCCPRRASCCCRRCAAPESAFATASLYVSCLCHSLAQVLSSAFSPLPSALFRLSTVVAPFCGWFLGLDCMLLLFFA